MKKIAYIVSLFPCWSETFILNEIIALTQKGVRVSIFSIRSDLEPLIHENAKPFQTKTTYARFFPGIRDTLFWLMKKPLVVLGLMRLVIFRRYKSFDIGIKNIWCVFESCFFARRVLDKGITHLHAHFATYPTMVALGIHRLTGVPFSFTAHAHDIFLDKGLLKEKVAAAQAVVAISEYNKKYIINHCGAHAAAKIQVIHCGLDLTEWHREEKTRERHLIVAVGRLTPMKGFDVLIKACAILKNKVNINCQIVGSGPARRSLEQLIAKHGLYDNVRLTGAKDNQEVKELISRAAVFVAPSVWDDRDGQDGIPLVLMEAMALGTPVIASTLSGIPELVDDEKNGMLVEPGNADQLAAKILRLVSDRILSFDLATAGRKKIEAEFDVEKTVLALTKIFSCATRQPDKKIKILFIIWSLERGGAERFLAGLLMHIDLSQFEPVLCCLNWKGVWAETIEQRGIKVIALNKKMGVDVGVWRQLIHIIKEGHFDIVNTHLWLADVMGRVAAMTARAPIIISTAQNVDIWKKITHRLVDWILAFRTTLIIAVSLAVKDYYTRVVKIPDRKILVIPNAIDIAPFENIGAIHYLYPEFDLKEDDFILACVGRLNYQKGHSYLFESVKLVKDLLPNLKIIVVGEGEERNVLENLVAALGIQNMVRFVGQRKDIPQILNLSQGLVLPSLFEGLPLCVLEAMAAGRPVIATDVGGTREIVAAGETGYLVPSKSPSALATAIQSLAANPANRQKMGQRAKEIVRRKYSIETITKKTEQLFTTLTH